MTATFEYDPNEFYRGLRVISRRSIWHWLTLARSPGVRINPRSGKFITSREASARFHANPSLDGYIPLLLAEFGQ